MRSIFLLLTFDDKIQNSHPIERWLLGLMVISVSNTFVGDSVLMVLGYCVCFCPVSETTIASDSLAHEFNVRIPRIAVCCECDDITFLDFAIRQILFCNKFTSKCHNRLKFKLNIELVCVQDTLPNTHILLFG